MSYDPQRFAMDYHNIGFRECISEVARYLVNHEGMDIQDPLRMRLMSHLQCFVAQRELNAKPSIASPSTTPTTASTGVSSANWSSSIAPASYPHVPSAPSAVPNYPSSYHSHGYGSHTPIGGGYVPNMSPTSAAVTSASHQTNSSHLSTSTVSSSPLKSVDHLTSELNAQNQQQHSQQHVHQHQQPHQHQQHHQQQHQQQQQQHQQQNQHYTTDGQQQQQDSVGPTYTDISDSRHTSVELGYAHYPAPGSAQAYNATGYNGSKPYRPWGAEMAY